MNPDPMPPRRGLARTAAPRGHGGGIGRALRIAGRSAIAAVPRMLIRILVWPRDRGISGLDDRQLADIGLTRDDVAGAGPAPQDLADRFRYHGHWRV